MTLYILGYLSCVSYLLRDYYDFAESEEYRTLGEEERPGWVFSSIVAVLFSLAWPVLFGVKLWDIANRKQCRRAPAESNL